MSAFVEHPVSREGLVRPSRVSGSGEGHPTPKEARGRSWRRSSRGYYVPSDVDGDRPEQRVLEASMVLADGTAVTGWAALRWRGGRWFGGLTPGGGRRPVTLLVGTHDLRHQPRHAIAVSAESVSPAMCGTLDDVCATWPRWAVSFEMRYARSVFESAKVLSLAAYDDLVSLDEMREHLSHQSGWTGVPQARKALAYAEENLWSPAEHDLGMAWCVDRGYDRPLFNRPVFDLRGHHLFTPDCIDPVAGVLGEYNGGSHREQAAYGKDLARWGAYAAHGLEAVAVSSTDLHDGSFGLRLRDAYRRASRRPAADRSWTVEYPAWWTPTHTVELRRSLTPGQRDRFLRYRRSG